ncbi:N-acetylglucosamine-6-phosphate deacetylase [Luteitalea pratensis]|uniref:N-acetylglucosamine-6-phosphate deacetylase n=1 Tax=Luteitalea pratensis TaxID=1855912 RepID=A0A143PRE3_LUTPR|nr:N-acetylglucosamine-6-phosphate deacetylase [Luteitalea pratensis]AMY11287.1 N-acetylglucosamine-6-phosphate deacetylase [Luteitalea pratensis]
MPEHRGPAFVDLQVNGFAGVDYNADVSIEQIVQSFAAMECTGVGLCLPTIITSTYEHFRDCARRLIATGHPIVAGIHMEGPYISPEDGFRGAHPRACVVAPSLDDFARRQDAADGHIRLVTVAAEVPGVLPVIESVVASGVRVALGHTNATTDQIADAVKAGATMSTHLGNGCPAVLPRHPNVIWDQLATDALHASFIVDGHHLPPAAVRAMVRAKGVERCMLVTDAMMAASAPPGVYRLGELEVIATPSGRVAAAGSLTLAGSALTMPRAVGLTYRWVSLDMGVVWAMASTLPAEYLGMAPRGESHVVWSDDASEVTHVAFRPDTIG